MVQMLVQGGAQAENLQRADVSIAEAAQQGADIALLPECCDLGWTTIKSNFGQRDSEWHPACRALSRSAQEHGIWVVIGLTGIIGCPSL